MKSKALSFSIKPGNLVTLCLLVVLLFAGCSDNADQNTFAQEALSAPAGIIEMTAGGARTEGGEVDADDWRISPAYSGLVSVVTPAFPNPVTLPGTVFIEINITSFQPTNGLQVYAFRQAGERIGPLFIQNGELTPGFLTIGIPSEQFATSTGTGTIANLYRIILYDARGNVITYGDVQVN